MFGGGWGSLDQMNKTLQKNREMLKAALRKKKHQAFSHEDLTSTKTKVVFTETKKYSESQRQDLLQKLAEEKRKENLKRIIVFLISIGILITLYWYFRYQFHYYEF
jgi:hypothetical protein